MIRALQAARASSSGSSYTIAVGEKCRSPGGASRTIALRSSSQRRSVVPGGFLVVAGEGFSELFPAFDGAIVTVGRIGNGLGNDGDLVRLLDADGGEVDAMSYGSDAGALDPPAPDVEAGHSLERVPAGTDTGSAADWVDQPAPSPGRAGSVTRPTAVPTDPPPPTVAPGAAVVLNEYLAAPRDIDWDGDGTAGPGDEWIELYNAGDASIDLRGWQLDDVADAGSPPFVVPDGPVLPVRGHRVLFKAETGVSLNNGGDTVRLMRPDGAEADVAVYGSAAPDSSWARDGDGAGPWVDSLAPSPGGSNGTGVVPTVMPTVPATIPAETPTMAPTMSPTIEPTTLPVPTISGTPGGSTPPAPTAIATSTPGTPPTSSPPGADPAPPIFLPLLLSEVLFDPLETGLDAAREWVELFNPSDSMVSLVGWSIGDAGAWDPLPGAAIVPARGYLMISATAEVAADFRADGVVALSISDGRIGGGLANGGDLVRLRGPTGDTVDAVSWGSSLSAFDPAGATWPAGFEHRASAK